MKGGIHLTEELINEILESIGLEKIEYELEKIEYESEETEGV
ncbi:hypothetical protein SAMN05660649_04978 [Desulfotomaculum arcticum]|uniref:Uncharacterized protein n=1 Tax=Desulfotruncus arcticus DSM 17038 TaxID=1121424 RepID=A0A1I2ZJK8_9FIRM|nr:hypothetical protein SAMN05660649_04978 [Desulfotomaculum arcticum] [Desulfotruncus arcticus DSM 17038]